jgi:hypothetical protein
MTITNKGTTPDRVNCVSSDASAQCQIHSMTMEGGVMKMRPVEGGLEIKPGERSALSAAVSACPFASCRRRDLASSYCHRSQPFQARERRLRRPDQQVS